MCWPLSTSYLIGFHYNHILTIFKCSPSKMFKQMARINRTTALVASTAAHFHSKPMEHFTGVGKKILGAALNYNDANVPKPKAPVMFLKPTTSYIVEGQDIVIPSVLTNVGHEVELGVIIGKLCKNVSVDEASSYIGGYCLGLDLTAFCELGPARANGLPWSMGKGFDTSNPVSRFIACSEIADPHNLDLQLDVNGVRRQLGNTKDLTYNSFELIAYLSKYMTLEPGDLIMTGTPKGAAQILAGDRIDATLSENGKEIVKITFNVK